MPWDLKKSWISKYFGISKKREIRCLRFLKVYNRSLDSVDNGNNVANVTNVANVANVANVDNVDNVDNGTVPKIMDFGPKNEFSSTLRPYNPPFWLHTGLTQWDHNFPMS